MEGGLCGIIRGKEGRLIRGALSANCNITNLELPREYLVAQYSDQHPEDEMRSSPAIPERLRCIVVRPEAQDEGEYIDHPESDSHSHRETPPLLDWMPSVLV